MSEIPLYLETGEALSYEQGTPHIPHSLAINLTITAGKR